MDLPIVTCPPDGFQQIIDVATLAFSEGMPPGQFEKFTEYAEHDRFFTAIDDGRFVCTSGVFSFRLTVPGGQVPAGGVTFVTVLPTHRRRGLATAMMRRMFRDCRERGEPVAMLWASEGSIYQRFGYGLATYCVNIEAQTQSMTFAREWPSEGSFRLLEVADALPIVAPIYDAVRAARPGFYERTPEWWAWNALFEKDPKAAEAKRVVVYETASGPEAYAVYSTKSNWTQRGTEGILSVREAFGSTPRGTREIWRWLFDVDLVRTVKTWRLPPDHPLLFLVAEPRRLGVTVGDGIWLRVLDVAAALERRGYEGDGRLTFELTDSFCPENAGRWTMEVEAGRATICRSEEAAGLALDATDLGAIYLGGVAPSALALSGRVRELEAGALAAADRIFTTAIAPWCPEEF